jgi:UDPglucose 6-dehydrogenase
VQKVAIIGTGYVGLVTGTCLAELGHKVICVDNNKEKIELLKKGEIPIYEPGLAALVKKNRKKGRLEFSTSIKQAAQSSDIIFIAVNTPSLQDGGADLSFVEACTRELAQHVNKYKLLVEKSTVPVQTGERIAKTLNTMNISSNLLEVASNPEFLREGSAIKDFLKPDRIVIGVESQKAEKLLKALYAKIKAPVVVTDTKSAELIKHASNSFLAMKISYINAIANICEKVGANVEQVSKGMGLDSRIGASFLKAGIGYGGSCFPKDIAAFIKISESLGYDMSLLKATESINNYQKKVVVKKLKEYLWTLKEKTIGVLGLAFKPNTDDLRNAPAIEIIDELLKEGAKVKAYDPVAMDKMKQIQPNIQYCRDSYEVMKGSDALLILTEWDEFKKIELSKVKKYLSAPIVIDGRNLFDPNLMASKGFQYASIGRVSSTSR